MTQALTGHGSFRTYTKRIGKTDDICRYCQRIDDAEHTLIYCPRFENYRETTRHDLQIENMTIENLFKEMIQHVDKWNKGHDMIKTILRIKHEDEHN